MKAVLTRVSHAEVTVAGEVVGLIDCPETCGILALVGVGKDDSADAWQTMVAKLQSCGFCLAKSRLLRLVLQCC